MATMNLRDQFVGANTVLTGWFDGRVTKADASVSQSSGNEMVTIDLQIEGGPNHGRTFRERAVLSPNTVKWFFQKMMAFGLGEEFFAPADGSTPSLDQTARELIGRPVRFELGEEVYNNVKREVVKNLEPAGPGAVRQNPGGMPGAMPGAAPVPGAMPGAVPAPTAVPAVKAAPTPKADVPAPPTLGGTTEDPAF